MSTDELIATIEEFMLAYDPYGFYDVYGSWKPNQNSYNDIKKQIESKDTHMIDWFEDVANNSDNPEEREDADVIYKALAGADVEASTRVTASNLALFGEDPDFFFTRDDIIDYVETPLEEQLPEIKSCRGYIDKTDDGKYILSVDIITDDYEVSGYGAPEVTIDMRKIRRSADLTKYVPDIIAQFKSLCSEIDNDYPDDPTQYGSLDDPITPWGGSVI